MIDRAIFEVKRKFDFGAWSVGDMRFKARQLTQMANCETMIDIGYIRTSCNRSKSRSQTRPNLKCYCQQKKSHVTTVALEALDGWLIIAARNFLSTFQRGADDRTDMLKLNKRIRFAKSIHCKLNVRSIPTNHMRFMGVHDAAHANFEGGASQQAHVILAVHKNLTAQKVPISILSWSRKKIKRVVRSSLAAETSSMATCMKHLEWIRTLWSQMTTAE